MKRLFYSFLKKGGVKYSYKRNPMYLFRAFILILCFSTSPLLSQEVIPLSSQIERKRISTEVYFLEDSNKSLGIEKVSSGEYSGKFKKSNMDPLNFGQTNFDYWIRITLKNPEKTQIRRILEIDYTNIDRVDFFAENISGKQELVNSSGMAFPYPVRKVNHRNFIYTLDFQPEQTRTFYLKLNTSGGLVFPLILWNPETFYHHNADIHLGLGLYYGIMCVMILYHLLIFLSTRDISYLFFVTNIFGFFGIQLVLTGHGFQYIWSEHPDLQRNLYVVFTGICMSSLVLFAQKFLNTEENINRYLNYSLNFTWALHTLLIFTPLFLPPEFTVKVSLALSILAPSLVLIAASICFFKNYRPARYFLLAFSFLCISGMFVVLKFANLVGVSNWADDGLYIGSSMSALIFSFALADKINILKKEKEDAQRKIFEAQKENLEMQKTLNDSLETLVIERTKTIEEQKLDIEAKAKLIEKDLAIAGKIQFSLLPSVLPKTHNVRIAYRCIPMLHVGGDFVDLISDRTGRALGIFICDVTGHGTGAAMVAAMVKMALADWSDYLSDPGYMLAKMRAQLMGKLNGNFVTATMITFYPESGRILIANAGHPEAILIRKANGKHETYRPSGIAINEFLSTPNYQTLKTELSKGDKLILYTDGLPEARSKEGDFYGDDRFLDLLKNFSELEPELFCNSVIGKIQHFTDEEQSSHDDMAMVVLEYLG
ncbi:serine/threonine protein phosphatase [Leptospira koniambonensis]|uniref:Serine/threonine protein phosphatase n=1 Tax=Leptospira koniambonensis TaxID=2484950 RepID=A0A4R9J864_9LEPT|nr:7TM diverse intracellular signaling domain-containing protein [Leptospira koniambonensis]TGL34983.1 serine/threonine protein phosphatase [Leptospira koniambonensis]